MRLRVGMEVALHRGYRNGQPIGAAQEVVVMDFRRQSFLHGSTVGSAEQVYIEHESGDCEWVPRHWLKSLEG